MEPMELANLFLYIKTGDRLVELFWSDNPPAEPETATAVIGINTYGTDGREMDGGELDIQGREFDLRLYARDCLELMGLPK